MTRFLLVIVWLGFSMVLFSQTAVSLSVDCGEGERGDTVCIDFRISELDSLLSMNFVASFDPNIVQCQSVRDFGLPDFSDFDVNCDNETGLISVVWFDQNIEGISIEEVDVLFAACFILIGNSTDTSRIDIDSENGIIEFSDPNRIVDDVTIEGCYINIECGALEIAGSVCSPEQGVDNGSIRVEGRCGTGPYIVQWQMMENSSVNGSFLLDNDTDQETIENLGLGTYLFTTIDDLGVESRDTFVLDERNQMFINFSTQHPQCAGEDNGSIEVLNFGGGAGIQTIQWLSGDSIIQFGSGTVFGLAEGRYTIILTDSLGCEQVNTVDLVAQSLSIDEVVIQDVICSGNMGGSIRVTASGGEPINGTDYLYEWSGNFSETSRSSLYTNLEEGTFFLRVSDDNGCDIMDTFQINSSKSILPVVRIDSIRCDGDSSACITVDVQTSGGIASLPYSFDWGQPLDVSFQTDTSIQVCGLPRGIYNLSISDSDIDGCSSDIAVEITQPSPLDFSLVSSSCASCVLGNDGSLIVIAFGGTPSSTMSPPYIYDWGDELPMSNVLSGLTGDSTYRLTVIDANACSDSFDIYVCNDLAVEIEEVRVEDVSCFGQKDGLIEVVISSGTQTEIESILWSNMQSGLFLDSLNRGEYMGTLRDVNGCSSEIIATVDEPDSFFVVDTFLLEPDCHGSLNGQIGIFAEGGQRPYLYEWSHSNVNQPIFQGVPAGNYSVRITDANNCELVREVELLQPERIDFIVEQAVGSICFDSLCNGMAEILVSGGPNMSAGYEIMWMNGQQDTIATDLCPGFVSLLITNGGLCGIVDSIEIPNANEIFIEQLDANEPSCFGDDDGSIFVQAGGGNGPYTYEWEGSVNNQVLDALAAGMYDIAIEDSDGCILEQTIELEQPEELTIEIDSANTNGIGCAGEQIGLITTNVIGGTPEYDFAWSPEVSSSSSANSLAEGDYFIAVMDQNGCSDTTSYAISGPTPISVEIPSPDEAECFGEFSTFTVSSADGGIGEPYFFAINNGLLMPLSDSIPLLAGNYNISIFDASGCSFDTFFTISQPPPITIDIQDSFEVDLGLELSLETSIDHVLMIDMIIWQVNEEFICIDSECSAIEYQPLADGNVLITAIDENGCTNQKSVRVIVDDSRDVYIPNVFSPNGDQFNDLFQVFAKNDAEIIEVFRIFNRWGEMVFEAQNLLPSRDGSNGWDGLYKGQEAPIGVYNYIAQLRFIDGESILYRGDVTLIR